MGAYGVHDATYEEIYKAHTPTVIKPPKAARRLLQAAQPLVIISGFTISKTNVSSGSEHPDSSTNASEPTAQTDASPPTEGYPPSTQPTAVSSLTDSDLDQLYGWLKHHVEIINETSPGISSEDLEKIAQQSNDNISQVRQEFCESIQQLTSKVEAINVSVSKQNTVIAALQLQLEFTVTEMKQSVTDRFDNVSSQINKLRSLVLSSLPPLVLQAATQPGGQPGQ